MAALAADVDELDLSSQFLALCGDAGTPRGGAALLRFARAQRGTVTAHAIVARVGSRLRTGSGRAALGDELWLVLEQTLVAALHVGDLAEARACLAALEAHFGKYVEAAATVASPRAVGSGEDEDAAPRPPPAPTATGSSRVRRLELMIAEAAGRLADADAGYKALERAQPNSGASKRRVAVARERAGAEANGPLLATRRLVEHLDVHSGDAEAWLELAELHLGAGRQQQAAFCYEELVLLTPNAAALHARLAELTAAIHAPSGGLAFTASVESGGGAAVEPGLRQARLQACEGVRLSGGRVAYAAAALADVSYLHALALCAIGRSKTPPTQLQLPHVPLLLRGETLEHMAARATASAIATAAGGSSAGGAVAQSSDTVATVLGTASALTGSALDSVEEAVALHALATHHLRALGQGAYAARLVAATAPLPIAGGGPLLGAFPALAVEHALVCGPAAHSVLATQVAGMKKAAEGVATARRTA